MELPFSPQESTLGQYLQQQREDMIQMDCSSAPEEEIYPLSIRFPHFLIVLAAWILRKRGNS